MRVKNPPRQHQVDMNNVEKTPKNSKYDTKISRSEPCLRFVNGDLEITMESVLVNQQVHQDSGPGIDEALDLAMPTRSRCKHEHYAPCFSIMTDLLSTSSEAQLEAMDLSTKNRESKMESAKPQNDMKTTFLYKMLTDSSFLENLRNNKQASNYACSFCKKKFSTEEELTEHSNVRKDESNQVACCACGKTFAQKRYLRYHQRCHSERSKFTCDICTKNYSRLDNLTRHNTFHTNPDKFPCTSCDRTFARKDLFKKHIKCHENRHRYYCSICDKYFKGPLSLENHKKLVHLSVKSERAFQE
ncbi:zinc finger protein 22-like [Venturia canescens]|uniref:zinc finger protein 22-like n=1 Tax=Venturia canescens TaxID=32260 RepID=UPI001C9D5EC5|nr:zinc finger protein 22-like [Venturia canescens]